MYIYYIYSLCNTRFNPSKYDNNIILLCVQHRNILFLCPLHFFFSFFSYIKQLFCFSNFFFYSQFKEKIHFYDIDFHCTSLSKEALIVMKLQNYDTFFVETNPLFHYIHFFIKFINFPFIFFKQKFAQTKILRVSAIFFFLLF